MVLILDLSVMLLHKKGTNVNTSAFQYVLVINRNLSLCVCIMDMVGVRLLFSIR